MAETALPLGALYSGATHDDVAAHRKAAEATPDGYIPTAFNPATKVQGGMLTVAKDRVPAGKNKPPTKDAISKGAKMPSKHDKGFGLFYELHGKGSKKIIFIMGLNNSCFGWLSEVEHFVPNLESDYQCLVFDNRGASNSDSPAGRYTTPDMAKDAMELMDHVGWTDPRSVHVVGVSMGGMIALELGKIDTKRIASLNLISTTSGQGRGSKSLLVSLPPLTGVSTITRIIAGRMAGFDSDEYRINAVLEMLFPPAWLAEKHPKDPKGRTVRDVLEEQFTYRFNHQRRGTVHGALAQIAAVAAHYVSPKELRRINEEIPAIAILTGDRDNLVNPGNSDHLAKHMPKANFVKIPGGGHALPLQCADKVTQTIEDSIARAEASISKL